MSPLPKIVHVIHSGAIGGGPRVLLDIATHTSYDHVVVAPDDGPLLAMAAEVGLETRQLRHSGKYSFVESVPFLRRLAAGAHILHLHGQFAGAYGAPAAWGPPCRVVYTAHFPSFVTDSNWHNRTRNWMAEVAACRFSDSVIACCNTMRHEYVVRRLLPAGKIRTVYNGVRANVGEVMNRDLRSEYGIPETAPVILGIGRFTDQKGFDTLASSVASVVSEHPGVVLVLVGDGPQRRRLERLVHDLGSADHVRFTGFARDPDSYYQLASVVVVPSRYDIFPLVPLEAMMHAKPVVASNLPVLSEAIQDGVTGMLVPQSPEELARAIKCLVASPDQAIAMGERGRERARAYFSVERMAREYEQVYNHLLEQAR